MSAATAATPGRICWWPDRPAEVEGCPWGTPPDSTIPETLAGLAGLLKGCRMSRTQLAPAGTNLLIQTPLRRALAACRSQFLLVGVFSGVVNLLQLTTSVYMMQVFDRVLATRVLDTLVYLSIIAIVAVRCWRCWRRCAAR